jgi:hypothetical protein
VLYFLNNSTANTGKLIQKLGQSLLPGLHLKEVLCQLLYEDTEGRTVTWRIELTGVLVGLDIVFFLEGGSTIVKINILLVAFRHCFCGIPQGLIIIINPFHNFISIS